MKVLFLFIFLSSSALSQESNFLFDRQWGIKNNGSIIKVRQERLQFEKKKGANGIDIEYQKTNSSNEIIVAIIDRGIDPSHPEFKGRIWLDPNCKFENKNDCYGKNIIEPSKPALDDSGHGTMVAGIIGANDNDIGIMGVTNKNVLLMPLKVLSDKTDSFNYKGKLMSDYFAEAIDFAVSNGAQVINISAGFPKLVVTKKVKSSIDNAISKNITIIAASGNNNKLIPVFPCNYQKVICVGAIDNKGEIAEFTNFGQRVDILAPGESIVSTYPTQEKFESSILRRHGYEVKKGSSFAAPYISGIAATLYQQNPKITVDEVRVRILSTAKPINFTQRKFSLYGLVQMKSALSSNTLSFTQPQIKDIEKIIINQDKSFKLKLSFKKLKGSSTTYFRMENNESGIDTNSKALVFENNKSEIILNGKINSFDQHNILSFEFELRENNRTYNYRIDALAAVNLNFKKTIDQKIQDKSDNVLIFRRGKKTSFMREVFSLSGELDNTEYFYRKRDAKGKVYSIGDKTLSIDKRENIHYIIKGDFNKDNIDDYLIEIERGKKKDKEFALRFYDQNLKPLYGNKSEWIIKGSRILDFKKAPLLYTKRRADFAWINYKDPDLGEILVPIVKYKGFTPQDDNGEGIIEYRYEARPIDHYYVLEPGSDNIVRPRVIDSFKTENIIKDNLNIAGFETLIFESILSNKNGSVNFLVSKGDSLDRSYFVFNFKNRKNFSFEPVISIYKDLVLTDNGVFSFESKKDIDSKVLFALHSREEGRIVYLDNDSRIENVLNIKAESYRDPYFGYLGSHKSNNKVESIFETRYWLHYYSVDGDHHKLPVNRESSFPGVDFSELMDSVVLNNDRLGVYINSTLLFGDQVYIITKNDFGFVAPIKYSVNIPENCVYMLPSKINGIDHMSFACKENESAKLVHYPLN